VSARTVRTVVLLVCMAGIAGMIVTSIADRDGAALTLGLITASAVVCLIVATAVSGASLSPSAGTGQLDEVTAARVEAMVADLVSAGATEDAVRALVGESMRLGRSQR